MDAAERDPELISVRRQMATLDAIALEKFEALGDDAPAQKWGAVLMSIAAFPDALAKLRESFGPLVSEEMDEAFKALTKWHGQLTDMAAAGHQAKIAELEIREIIQEQVKVARQETRREQALVESVTAKQLQVFVALILDSLMRHVEDTNVRRRIQGDLIRAIGHGGSPGPGSGG